MKIRVKIVILMFLISAITACVGQSREATFEATLRAYEQAVRWGNIEKVNQFRKKPLTFSNIAKERFKNIKVTSYEVTGIESSTALKNIVMVKVKYYHEQHARIRSLEDKQEWHFDETSEAWYISSSLPNF